MAALHDVSKTFGSGDSSVRALDKVTVAFQAGQLCAVVGASGAGKTTLLTVACGFELPDTGQVWIAGRRTDKMGSKRRAAWRRNHVGLVTQHASLVNGMSVEANVKLPAALAGHSTSPERLDELFDAADLAHRRHRKSENLSGGEATRAGLIRAMAARPEMIGADEPTGSLDLRGGRKAMGLLRRAADDGACVVVVTHDPGVAAEADRIVTIRDGRVTGDHQRM